MARSLGLGPIGLVMVLYTLGSVGCGGDGDGAAGGPTADEPAGDGDGDAAGEPDSGTSDPDPDPDPDPDTDTDPGPAADLFFDEVEVTLAGAAHKGPFVLGSSVRVSPLDENLVPTGAVFNTQIANDQGEFEISFDVSGPVAIEVVGFYYNEATGSLSGSSLTLRALYVPSASGKQQVGVNLITHLTAQRVEQLVVSQGETFGDAVAQAERELREGLGLGAGDYDAAVRGTELNLLGGDTEENAYLFLVGTVLAQAAALRDESAADAELQQLLNRLARDFGETGTVSTALQAELQSAATSLDAGQVQGDYEQYLASTDASGGIPARLDRVLDSDGDTIANGVDNCPSDANTDQADQDGDGPGDVCDPCPSVADLDPVCGDGVVCPGTEFCDDGFTDVCGSCNADCTAVGAGSTCGDGVRCEESEACDDGHQDACGSCNVDCTGAGAGSSCGDGALCPETEACDDGYEDACGSCNSTCTNVGGGSTCGDGVQCPETEFCDDGYEDACGSCNAECTAAGVVSSCGDGVQCPETEFCDDGYEDACGSCNADCSAAGAGSVCGDTDICAETEFCDEGDQSDCGTCNGSCTAAGSGGIGSGVCEDSASGIFAVRVQADVWWQDDRAPPLIDPGRGGITMFMMAEVTQVQCGGDTGAITLQMCGLELPEHMSDANCDAFLLGFPNAMWDAPSMPSFVTTGSRGLAVGEDFLIDAATGLMGISLNDPNSAWPTPAQTGTVACPEGSGESCFPDHDNDGIPGLTGVAMKVGQQKPDVTCGGFQLPFVFRGFPLDALGALDDQGVKAETVYLGMRTRTGAAATIGDDCVSGSGECSVEAIDVRVWDCERTDGQPCAPAQAAFVDESVVSYNILGKGDAPPPTVIVPPTQGGGPLDQTPSPGSTSAIIRLDDLGGTVTCDQVRAAAWQ